MAFTCFCFINLSNYEKKNVNFVFKYFCAKLLKMILFTKRLPNISCSNILIGKLDLMLQNPVFCFYAKVKAD
jgi:hypothetical protein